MPHGLWKSAQQYTTARHFRQLKCSFARTTRIDLERVREKECTPQFALQKALAAIVGKVWRLTARCRRPALTCCTASTWDVHLPVARAAAASRSRCPSALDQAEPILVVSLSALLVVSGSNSAADTCAWSPTDPIPRGRSLMVTVAVAPLARSPSWQSMLLLTICVHWPWVASKDRSCTPPGTVVLQVSASGTADAGDGPWFVIATV